MKLFALAAAAALFALPSYAATYNFDYSVGTSTGGDYLEFNDDSAMFTSGNATVSGFIETDGTLGAIDRTNILSWQFLITDEPTSGGVTTQIIASTPVFGDSAITFGAFVATASTLTADGNYEFGESKLVQNANGDDVMFKKAIVAGDTGIFGWDKAEISGWTRTCDIASDCSPMVRFGANVYTYNDSDTKFIGTVSAVPLPAGFPMLLAGLGAFAYLRRKNI